MALENVQRKFQFYFRAHFYNTAPAFLVIINAVEFAPVRACTRLRLRARGNARMRVYARVWARTHRLKLYMLKL